METEGRDEDGLNKCYSVLLWYSHHLPHRRGQAATALGPPQTAKRSLFRLSLSNFEGWQRRGWKFAPALLQIPFRFPDPRGSETRRQQEGTMERSQDAGLARTRQTSASWQTHNKHLRLQTVPRPKGTNMKTNEGSRPLICEERTHIEKNGTLQSILLPLVSYRI